MPGEQCEQVIADEPLEVPDSAHLPENTERRIQQVEQQIRSARVDALERSGAADPAAWWWRRRKERKAVDAAWERVYALCDERAELQRAERREQAPKLKQEFYDPDSESWTAAREMAAKWKRSSPWEYPTDRRAVPDAQERTVPDP